ncbi:MAG: hypothetical protein IJD65_01775 [Mailhella sp.]|nr:hypothetical protein [Mailhella sp.]
MRVIFSIVFLCLGLLSSAHCSAAAETSSTAERYFDAAAGEAYHAKMAAEMSGLVRLNVKGSNVRIRSGAGTAFEIDRVAQRGDVFFAKKAPVKGEDGLSWYEVVAALHSQEDTSVEKVESKFICANFVTADPLTRETKNYIGDEGFIKRQLYRVFPAGPVKFILDRDTPFRPSTDCPLVTDMGRNILPAGVKLCYGSYAVSESGYLEFSAELALPEGDRMNIGWILLEDYSCLNFGRHETDMRLILDNVVNSYRQFHKGEVKNI